jgi:mRNA interferase HigB
METANFSNHNELKEKYPSASVINKKRVVFNINGNNYRLIVDVEYRIKLVFVVWFGTHSEYDEIDAETIEYEN